MTRWVTVEVTLQELEWIIQTLIDYEEGISELTERLIDLRETTDDERGNR